MTAATLVHLFLAAASSTTKKSSGSSYTFIIFIVVIGAAGYFLLLRPQQQKAKKQRAMQSEIGVGDEVLTIGGIVGTVLDIDSERVTIITGVQDGDEGGAPGQPTRLVLVRSAVARKVEPVVAPPAQGGSADDLHFDNELDYGDQSSANGSAGDDSGGAGEGDGERRADGGSGEGKGP
ncbi:MAG TPA: preprotein translocase subunit YajC [Acidimicrobiales bacterium]|nr:preprotein translocase subunit YajC [Acidimicrobiales bacterium]